MQLNKSMHIILLTNALLVLAASVAGLFISEFYRYRLNIISTFEIAGQDIVSLLISIIFISLILKPNKTISFFIISGGFLIYIAYTYAYFSFGQI